MENKFTTTLKEKLEGKNLSLLARELGIPKTLLFDWVSANRLPSMKNIEHIKRIADYLGMSLDDLFFGQSQKKTITSIEFQDEGKKYRVNIERIK